ncbi:MAG: S-methyl-5-thioribose-1-phosphate isomerase [Sedimentisphaerales bacterium]|nr:S-methyl-5-thioribose-1-phosphate isomerase [Sedimentisphaerales bacterium]
MVDTIKWVGDINGHVELIDQTLLPVEFRIIEIHDVAAMWQAIKTLQVRGAPAIGIAAAFGVVLGLQKINDLAEISVAKQKLTETCVYLASSRPTAVNLFWALERMQRILDDSSIRSVQQLKERLLAETRAIRDEDAAMCRAIGRNGADFIKDGSAVLTHCNAGGLATADYGTALAVMFTAHEQGKKFRVFADETRPLLQGARLTTWELMQAGIDVTLICDNMAGYLMSQGKIDLVITGADRIAANGDTANKIGTYSLAMLAQAHHIPFYIAAPSSTFDTGIATGRDIPIEERDPDEVTRPFGRPIAPDNVKVYNPAFDVTPHQYIRAIITEAGVIHHPNSDTILQVLTR